MIRSGLLLLMAALGALAAPALRAADFCSTCEIQAGAGFTYHFWEWTHSAVIPLTLDFDHNRWELGAFRFAHAQEYYVPTFGAHVRFTDPYWGFSLTRRLELFKHPHWGLLVGLGAAYRSEQDRQIASHWNFSELIGVRLRPARGWTLELVGRHWSNGGLKLPNHGQDFATLMVTVYPGALTSSAP